MKPRTKLEKRVAGLSGKLAAITRAQKEWAKGHLFPKEAYKCKDELWCSECGGAWVSTDQSELDVTLTGGKTECPYCHTQLEMKVSRKKKLRSEVWMDVLQTVDGFQVIRHVICGKSLNKWGLDAGSVKDEAYYYFEETVQEWIAEDGKRVVMAKPMNMGCRGWLHSQPMSIKNEYGNPYNGYGDLYAIHGWIYPRKTLTAELKKRGLNGKFPDVNASMLIRALLKGNNDAELCLKTGQLAMLGYMLGRGDYQLRYKPSFNICNRNRYIIKDASMWVDYIDLLCFFVKDVRNAKYVCPKDLTAEHDRLMKKKQAIMAKARREQDRLAAMRKEKTLREAMNGFYLRMRRFFGLEITDGDIVIRPLESITQFYQEGKAMRHCVYTNGYYKKKDALILSARDKEGKRVETVELNLNTLKVVQSRAVCNQVTPQHERIVQLVERNARRILERMIG